MIVEPTSQEKYKALISGANWALAFGALALNPQLHADEKNSLNTSKNRT
jgi:hypothetical protein